MEDNNLQAITSLRSQLDSNEEEIVAGSFHSLAELLLSFVNRLEEQEKRKEHSSEKHQ